MRLYFVGVTLKVTVFFSSYMLDVFGRQITRDTGITVSCQRVWSRRFVNFCFSEEANAWKE